MTANSSMDWRYGVGLTTYLLFTLIAVAGFGSFGLHPQLLAEYPALTSFYVVSFRLFAQAHVVVAAVVLGVYLVRRIGGGWVVAGALVYAASLASELLGTATGLPFGSYAYSGLLGWKWFGLVPALIPLSWFLMALPSYVLARRRFRRSSQRVQRFLLGAALLTAWDVALDPAMSGLTSYWSWGEGGPYYGMPLINLGGWMLTGIVLMGLIETTLKEHLIDRLSVRWHAAYYGLTILMPLGMIAAAGMWMGVGVSVVVAGGLAAFALSNDARPPTEAGSAGDPVSSRAASTPRTAAPSSATASPMDPSSGTPGRAGPSQALSFVRNRAAEAGSMAAPVDFFAAHSRSFSFASRWFERGERRLIAGLYAFCRTTDDFVDRGDADAAVVAARLEAWAALVEQAYATGDSGIPWLDAVMSASADRGAPIDLAHELIEGVRMDLVHVRMQTWEDLDLYMYRVASVVGIWMCYLFGVRDPDAHAQAAALGKAMQLTNILRDVGEDLAEDRVYLPREVLDRYGLTEEVLRAYAGLASPGPESGLPAWTRSVNGSSPAEAVPAAYRAMMHEMIGRAEALYEVAKPGLSALPETFGRAAAVASSVYRGIHAEVVRNGYDNLRRRAVTSPPRKLLLAGRALWELNAAKSALAPRTRLSAPRSSSESASATAAVPTSVVLWIALVSSLVTVLVSTLAVRTASAACPGLADVRSSYIEAVDDEQALRTTRAAIDACDGGVYRAYDGALIALEGKHAFWPPSKLKSVRRGLDVLDDQVRAHPDHVEIRYLRLLTCYHLPGILGRGWSVADDFDVLAVLLPDVAGDYPPALYAEMVRFVLRRGGLSEARREALTAALDHVILRGES
ncbi:MAG: carotenoid biosynthesis protein [Rhodothermales bacterium]